MQKPMDNRRKAAHSERKERCFCMAREFARAFYHSKAWKQARDAYVRSQHGICERCAKNGTLSKGEIVHHREHLTPENIGDPAVSLSPSNFELLCRKCHADEHPEIYGRDDEGEPPRYAFDEFGDLVEIGGKEILGGEQEGHG